MILTVDLTSAQVSGNMSTKHVEAVLLLLGAATIVLGNGWFLLVGVDCDSPTRGGAQIL